MADFSDAGISINKSVMQISDVLQNYRYRKRVRNMASDLEVGLSVVDSIEWSDLFPPVLTQVIDIGEKTWNLSEVLGKMAEYYKDQIENSLESLMKLIEPILMAFVAIIIGTIVASVFLPMAELINIIGQ